MAEMKMPEFCPSCGAEGSLIIIGNEYVCTEENCGRAFLIDPKRDPDYVPKVKSEPEAE